MDAAIRVFFLALPLLITARVFAAVNVDTVGTLRAALEAANAGGDPEIVLADGTYDLDAMLWVAGNGITVRSASGERDRVVLRGQGIGGAVTHVFNVAGDHFIARDMTLRDVSQHAVQLQPNVDWVVLSNLHILDTGEQMVKVAFDANDTVSTSDYGILENSLLEYSAGVGPQYYIGGIDAHRAVGWLVRGNTFRYIRSPAGSPAEHAVHFWNGSVGTHVDRNRFVDCDRGIGFGLGDRGHTGGVIRNNMIYNGDTSGFADVAIGLESAAGAQVYNNTVILGSGYPNAIEYRFAATRDGLIANNLTNAAISSRDGGSATLGGNLTGAAVDWFIDAAAGELHLAQAVAAVVDQGDALVDAIDDFDGETRPIGAGIDIGADEWNGAAGEACSSSGAVTISDRRFGAGEVAHCRSDTEIGAGPAVTVGDGSAVIFESPAIRLGSGFAVETGAWFQARTLSAGQRLMPADFTYQGAFRLPDAFNWGARGASYYPAGDGGSGSLLVLGFEASPALFAEVSLPGPLIAGDWQALPLADSLTGSVEFDAELIENTACGDYTYAGDLEYVPRRGLQGSDKLYGAALCWYPEGAYGDANFPTVWMSELDGSEARGLYRVGPDVFPFHGNKTGEYLFSVPQWYADLYLGGRTLITGKSRGTPHGSQGPALIAFQSWDTETPEGYLDALMLLYYRYFYPECAGPNVGDKAACDFPDFTMCDAWTGGAFVESGGRRAIVLAGTKGLGDNGYGAPAPGDCEQSQGYHCDPYERQVLFYDVEELGAAALGRRDPWTVVPYAVWRPAEFFLGDDNGHTCGSLGGVTIDAANGRLYVIERGLGGNDENAAVVHVWSVATGA